MRDSGFGCSWDGEAGFAEIVNGMRDRKWDAGFLQKGSGNAGSEPPFPDPV